ncbi:hypothetical protein PG990_006710 [Apiospora arundinis]
MADKNVASGSGSDHGEEKEGDFNIPGFVGRPDAAQRAPRAQRQQSGRAGLLSSSRGLPRLPQIVSLERDTPETGIRIPGSLAGIRDDWRSCPSYWSPSATVQRPRTPPTRQEWDRLLRHDTFRDGRPRPRAADVLPIPMRSAALQPPRPDLTPLEITSDEVSRRLVENLRSEFPDYVNNFLSQEAPPRYPTHRNVRGGGHPSSRPGHRGHHRAQSPPGHSRSSAIIIDDDHHENINRYQESHRPLRRPTGALHQADTSFSWHDSTNGLAMLSDVAATRAPAQNPQAAFSSVPYTRYSHPEQSYGSRVSYQSSYNQSSGGRTHGYYHADGRQANSPATNRFNDSRSALRTADHFVSPTLASVNRRAADEHTPTTAITFTAPSELSPQLPSLPALHPRSSALGSSSLLPLPSPHATSQSTTSPTAAAAAASSSPFTTSQLPRLRYLGQGSAPDSAPLPTPSSSSPLRLSARRADAVDSIPYHTGETTEEEDPDSEEVARLQLHRHQRQERQRREAEEDTNETEYRPKAKTRTAAVGSRGRRQQQHRQQQPQRREVDPDETELEDEVGESRTRPQPQQRQPQRRGGPNSQHPQPQKEESDRPDDDDDYEDD